jgi:RHS repeat-associated protein
VLSLLSRLVRLLIVVACGSAVLSLVGAVSASADSWTVEGGTHYLWSGSEVVKSWTAREWQVWRKEVEAFGECMGVLEGCSGAEFGAKTPVEDVTKRLAGNAQEGSLEMRGYGSSLNSETQSAVDQAGVDAGTLPGDLGRTAIATAKLGSAAKEIGVVLGNGLDQLFEVPGWQPFSKSEKEAVEEHSEHLSWPELGLTVETEECPDGQSSCKKGQLKLPGGIYLGSSGDGDAIRIVESGEHNCEVKEGKDYNCTPYLREIPAKSATYVPVGYTEMEETIESGHFEAEGDKEFKLVYFYEWKPLPECGVPPSGLECKLIGVPAPGLITPEIEEHNRWAGLPSQPEEAHPVTLPTEPPAALSEEDLEAISGIARGRERIEEMFYPKSHELQEYEEQESELFGLSTGGEPNRGSCHSKKPVACATGNEVQTQTDLSVGGRGPALQVALTYNSKLASKQTSAGQFGFGWTGSYSAHVELKAEGTEATVYQDNGSAVTFLSSGGGWTTVGGSLVQATFAVEGSGYVYTLPDRTIEHFNSAGLLTSVVDRYGNTLTMTRSSEGRLESVADSAGRKISLKYNSGGQVESASDPMGHTVKYTYESGSLATVTLPGEATARWQLKYNSSHELTSVKDGRGYATTIEYNAEGQVESETDPLHRTTKWSYGPTVAGSVTTITEPNGSTTVEDFNEWGSPTTVTHASGTPLAASTTSVYNGADELLASTNPDGHTTKYGYNTTGDRTSETNADGDETKWEYDGTHDVTGITLPMGEKTTIKRNSHGSAEVIERPAPGSTTQKTSYKYDSAGDVESMTNPLEHTWKYEYDSYGDRKSETDPEGNKRTWEYNEDSQETATVSPRGNVTGGKPTEFTTKIERDAQGRALKITDPLGHTTKYTYDADGNTETITDGNSHKTTYTYDEDDELVKAKEANGNVSETEYDTAGEVIARIDGNKHVWKYTRNELEQNTELVDPLGRKTLKEYEALGNLIKLTDPEKRTTTYAYDPASRLTGVSYSDGKTPAVKYEYNKDGDRTTMTDGTGTSTYGYDQLDRMTESENGHKAVIKYEYDLANDQTKITYPNGKAVTRAFDKDDRVEKVTDWSSNITKFTYNPDSQLATTVYPTATKDEDTYAYNDADQMTEIKMKKGTETLASLVYTRDNDGQVKKTTAKSLPGTEAIENTYDEANRLTKAGSTEYKYDPANNPTTTGASTNTFNEADELTKGTSASYTYDELGERTKTTPTSGPATTYGYDQAGNLITVERPKEGTTPKIEDSYAYNGEGLRTNETISGTTSYLTWQTSGIELPSILTNETNSFIYGPNSMPIEQINTTTGTVTYLHHDQAGSTRLLTGSAGTVTGKCSYSAYGTPTCEGTTTTSLGFDGQYTNSDTGLIYMRAREYDPSTAQFLSVDPLVASTHAPYNYAEDNPLNEADPTGLGNWLNLGIPSPGEVAESLNPVKYYEEEIESYENGCGYFASVAHGLEGAVVGVLDASGAGEEELGVEAADQGIGGVIKGYTQHGLEQAIERDAGRGVSPSAILDAVRSPLSETVQSNGAIKYVGQNAVVVVRSDGQVITTYARNSAGLRGQP